MEEEGVRASHGVAVGDRLAAEQGAAEEGSMEEEGVRSSHGVAVGDRLAAEQGAAEEGSREEEGVAVGDRLAAEQGADWSLETSVQQLREALAISEGARVAAQEGHRQAVAFSGSLVTCGLSDARAAESYVATLSADRDQWMANAAASQRQALDSLAVQRQALDALERSVKRMRREHRADVIAAGASSSHEMGPQSTEPTPAVPPAVARAVGPFGGRPIVGGQPLAPGRVTRPSSGLL